MCEFSCHCGSKMFISTLFVVVCMHVQAIKQVQIDYEKRLKEVESQREQLLDEMETRETSLIAKVKEKHNNTSSNANMHKTSLYLYYR